jgi:hypothetical protein
MDEQQLSFAAIDLVTTTAAWPGDHCQTLHLSDVFTGWTKTEAVPNKAQVGCLKQFSESVSGCLFPCAVWIRTTEASSWMLKLRKDRYNRAAGCCRLVERDFANSKMLAF